MPATKSPAQNPPQYSRGRVSALGIFAEIDTILTRHRQKTSLALALPLQEKISAILPSLGIKNLPEEKFKQITSDIAQETTNQSLEDLNRVQTSEQIGLVLADNLTGTIINHPDLAGRIKADDSRVFTKVVLPTQEIYDQNQDILEKAAVLANLANIANLQEKSEAIKNLVEGSVEQTVETETPLTAPEQREAAKADLLNYLTAYKEELAKRFKVTEDNIPSLKDLQNAQENAHTEATKKMAAARPTPIGPKPTPELPAHSLTANLAQVLYLKPRSPTPAPLKLPTAGNLILSSPTRVRDAYLSLLSFDQEKLAKALKETSAEIEKYKNKKSLDYRQRKAYQDALKKQARYVAAQAFHVKQPKKAGAYRTLFARAYGGRPEVASGQAWVAENYFLPSMPRIIARNERLAAGAAFGSLGFSFAGVNFGSIFSHIRGQALSNITVGMGIAPASTVKNMARKITGIAGGVAGGLLLYFAGLAQAALAGALIGGGIGATAGAIVGAAIPVAMLGPAGILLWPVTIPLGIATGGLVGIVAGGLIGWGIAAGSTTAISTGVGAGIGGVVGGYIGLGVGSTISGAFITFAAAACAATGVGCILVPIAAVSAPIITTVSTAIGALVGAAVGAAVGYVIGHYIISPTVAFVKGAFDAIGSAFTGGGTAAGSAAAGFFSAVGSFFTGLASTVWGGITTAAGATLGFLSGAANFIVGGLTSLSIPASAAAIPVVGGIGAVAVGGTIIGIVTATSFFSPEGEFELPPAGPPGENQFFAVTKSGSPERLENSDLPRDITFTITLTAKETKLTNIQVSDEIKVQSRNADDFNVTEVTEDGQKKSISEVCKDKIPPEILPRANWLCTFSITASKEAPNFTDSLVANTVTIVAKPEGQLEATASAVATVIIGNPPTICGIIELQGPWASDEKGNIDKTCKTLDKSPKIASLLQKAGTIYLVRIADGSYPSGQCAQVAPANTITIACRMVPEDFAKYVIIHEFGHVLGNYNGGTYQRFLNQGIYNQEGLMPTYPFAPSLVTWGVEAESFAEMISDYVISKTYNFNPRAWSGYPGGPWNFAPPKNGYTTFPKDRPAHYNFARTEIYGGVQY